jgi:hypothetical protein
MGKYIELLIIQIKKNMLLKLFQLLDFDRTKSYRNVQ